MIVNITSYLYVMSQLCRKCIIIDKGCFLHCCIRVSWEYLQLDELEIPSFKIAVVTVMDWNAPWGYCQFPCKWVVQHISPQYKSVHLADQYLPYDQDYYVTFGMHVYTMIYFPFSVYTHITESINLAILVENALVQHATMIGFQHHVVV